MGALLAVATAAQATMIGDVLTFARAYPTTDTSFGTGTPVSTTVTANSLDTVLLQDTVPPGEYYWAINPGADSIRVDVLRPAGMLGTNTIFDGIVFSGFSATLASVSYTTSNPEYVVGVSLNATLNQIELNLTSIPAYIPPGAWINITVVEQAGPGVPDGGATVALLGAALAAFAAIRRTARRR